MERYAEAMIWNIIDRREQPYRWRDLNAIGEAVEHDNSCRGTDQAPEADPLLVVDYDALEAVSVQEAIAWANQQRCPVTLYLYDTGRGFAAMSTSTPSAIASMMRKVQINTECALGPGADLRLNVAIECNSDIRMRSANRPACCASRSSARSAAKA
jgi:hypothetical protein